jgi:hypothetical protein
MSKVLFLFVAGIFVGAVIFELYNRSKTKLEFDHMLEGVIVKEADELFAGSLAKNEEQFMADFKK